MNFKGYTMYPLFFIFLFKEVISMSFCFKCKYSANGYCILFDDVLFFENCIFGDEND